MILQITQAMSAAVVQAMLTLGSQYVLDYIELLGDDVIPNGLIEWPGTDGILLSVRNAANHRVTWGVLDAALTALGDYMSKFGYGVARSGIFDGNNQVGQGTIGS